MYLRQRWSERVKELPGVTVLNPPDPEQACGIGAMRIGGVDSGDLTDFLERKYRVHVRPRFVEGEFDCIRVSPSVFTTLEEVDLFAAGIEDAARNGIAALAGRRGTAGGRRPPTATARGRTWAAGIS